MMVRPRQTGQIYSLEHWGDRFVVLTNSDGAEDFKLMLAPEAAPRRANWRACCGVADQAVISFAACGSGFALAMSPVFSPRTPVVAVTPVAPERPLSNRDESQPNPQLLPLLPLLVLFMRMLVICNQPS